MKKVANILTKWFLLAFISISISACGINTESDTHSEEIKPSQAPQPIIQQESDQQLEMESMDAFQTNKQKELQRSQRPSLPGAKKTVPLSIEEDDMPRLD
jgi:hypothetical protein